ncbi:hypothetical protein FOL47_004552 [Perkinsus chesapeaki]|uniref:tRNA/rRNA methyltransferase SpoU type domain-containing protein n=1 Tax=Perkinsus chesapeaki TaxID=330153 RepID=A0A7J6M1Y2_PERCH|nr:hypothetical protein FOL47_004552 [Perkinsus chesapeaki]
MISTLSSVTELSQNLQPNSSEARENVAKIIVSGMTVLHKEAFVDEIAAAVLSEEVKLVNELTATIAARILDELRTAKILDIFGVCGKLQVMASRRPECQVPFSSLYSRLVCFGETVDWGKVVESLVSENSLTDVQEAQFASAAIVEIFRLCGDGRREIVEKLRRRIIASLPDTSGEVREVIYCRILPLISDGEFMREILEFTEGNHEERMILYCQVPEIIDHAIDWDDVRACISRSVAVIHRKRARWLVERLGGAEALGSTTWQWYWALVESLDEFACHMFKELFTPKLRRVAIEAAKVDRDAAKGWEMSPKWIEALLDACLSRHDNEAIPKHVLTELGAHPDLAQAVLKAVDPEFFCHKIVRGFDENLTVFCNQLGWYARPEKAVTSHGGAEGPEAPAGTVEDSRACQDLVNSYVTSGGKISMLLKEVLEGLVNYTSTRVFLEAIGNAANVRKEIFDENILMVCLRFATTRVKYFKTALRPKILSLFTSAISRSFELPSESVLSIPKYQDNLIRFYSVLCAFTTPVPPSLIWDQIHGIYLPKILSDTASEALTVEMISGLVWTLPANSAELEDTLRDLESNLQSIPARAYLPESAIIRWLALTLFLDQYHGVKICSEALARGLPELTSEESFPRMGWLVASLTERYQIKCKDNFVAKVTKLSDPRTPLLEQVHLVQMLAAESSFNKIPEKLAKILFRMRPRSTSDRSHTYALGICDTFSWRVTDLFHPWRVCDDVIDVFYRCKWIAIRSIISWRSDDFISVDDAKTLMEELEIADPAVLVDLCEVIKTVAIPAVATKLDKDLAVQTVAELARYAGGYIYGTGNQYVTEQAMASLMGLVMDAKLIEIGGPEAVSEVKRLMKRLIDIGNGGQKNVLRSGLSKPLVAMLRSVRRGEVGESLRLDFIEILAALCVCSDSTSRTETLTFISAVGGKLAEEVLLATLAHLEKTRVSIYTTESGAKGPATPMPFSGHHRAQLRGWQVVMCLVENLREEAYRDEVAPILYKHLMWPHLPDIRDYQETVACYLAGKFKTETLDRYLLPALEQYDATPQCIASVLLVATYLGIAQYAIHTFGLPTDGSDYSEIKGLFDFMAKNRECVKLRSRQVPVYDKWNINRLVGVQGLHAQICKTSVEEMLPNQILMQDLREAVATAMAEEWHYTPDLEVAHMFNEGIDPLKIPKSSASQMEVSSDDETAAGHQRKYVPLMATELFPKLHNKSVPPRSDLIIVASFVDKAPNLAGLCRTAEVFGASRLVVANKLRVLRDQTFKSVAVTSEKWMPIEEVQPEDLPEWLGKQKDNGSSLVGVEQTTTSKQMERFAFPKKTVLVLGAEKEGLPTSLIPLLDNCVEIPQFGVIRSLNVHVTGALCIWE